MFVGGSRFSYRLIRLMKKDFPTKEKRELEKVMIVGAGEAGEKIYREIYTSQNIYKEVVCFIDDDKTKIGRRIHDVLIYGGRHAIQEACDKYKIDEILVAMPSIDQKEMAEILNICKDTKCKIKKLPGIYQMVNGDYGLCYRSSGDGDWWRRLNWI